MSNEQLIKPISRNGFLLGLFAIVTTGLVVLTFTVSEDRIIEQQRRVKEKALFELIPEQAMDNILLEDTVPISSKELLADGSTDLAYIARKNGEVVGIILPVLSTEGYNGKISLIVGIHQDGRLAGVRILSHRETPGLGDKIDLNKSDWLLGFDGKSLQLPPLDGWHVKKDGGEFDQLTGATITPRAIVKAVRKALIYFSEHKELLATKTVLTPTTTEQAGD
ncbi:MAG: electron transport complex subunit RsxG [Pseudomonadales bacterium]|nr:electron transport complex subunit RsxG [Pseudomonadales bacterium]